MTQKKQADQLTLGQVVSLFLAFMILFSSLVNSLTSANFLALPTYTYASLAIFLASIILWLFVAIDWPSLVCLICLGFLP